MRITFRFLLPSSLSLQSSTSLLLPHIVYFNQMHVINEKKNEQNKREKKSVFLSCFVYVFINTMIFHWNWSVNEMHSNIVIGYIDTLPMFLLKTITIESICCLARICNAICVHLCILHNLILCSCACMRVRKPQMRGFICIRQRLI